MTFLFKILQFFLKIFLLNSSSDRAFRAASKYVLGFPNRAYYDFFGGVLYEWGRWWVSVCICAAHHKLEYLYLMWLGARLVSSSPIPAITHTHTQRTQTPTFLPLARALHSLYTHSFIKRNERETLISAILYITAPCCGVETGENRKIQHNHLNSW